MRLIAIHDGHSASAAYMHNGTVLFAIQEERLCKLKNAGGFPAGALDEILKRYGLGLTDIDYFVFSGMEPQSSAYDSRAAFLEKYRRRFEPPADPTLFRTILDVSVRLFRGALSQLRNEGPTSAPNVRAAPLLDQGVSVERILYVDHHLCHAAAAAYGSGKDTPTAVITSDSAGDGLSGTVSLFENGKLLRKSTVDVGNSIARIYSLATYYLGMVPMEHEYKLMGLAAYVDRSTTSDEIADTLCDLFEISSDKLSYCRKSGIEPVYRMASRLEKLFLRKRFDHISAGVQTFVERLAIDWVRSVVTTLDVRHVALAGGLFMNVKLNKLIAELDEVDDVFVFPSCGDESNVFGALYHTYNEQSGTLPSPLSDYYLGGDFTAEAIEQTLKNHTFKSTSTHFEKISNINQRIAHLLADKEIVARFSGRMEFGARALGNRSILANPTDQDAVRTINKMIKSRDFWMPFAPSMTQSDRYLLNPKGLQSPYMMLAFDALPNQESAMRAALHPYDGTSRPQQVSQRSNPAYFDLIEKFNALTGNSVILNTSFNLHGFPIVYTPEDALYVFENSGLRHLALGDFLISKD